MRARRAEAGGSLVLCLVLAMVLVAMSGAFLATALSHSQAAEFRYRHLQTLLAAESGVSASLEAIHRELARRPAARPEELARAGSLSGDVVPASRGGRPAPRSSGGAYGVAAVHDPALDGFRLSSLGSFGARQRRLDVLVRRKPVSIFSVGLFGDKKAELEHRVTTDSVDSDLPIPIYAQAARGEGDVGSNGKIKVKHDVSVKGDVFTSASHPKLKEDDRKKVVEIERHVEVQGDVRATRGSIELERDVHVTGEVSTGSGSVRTHGDVRVDGGTSESGPPVPRFDMAELKSALDQELARFGGGRVDTSGFGRPHGGGGPKAPKLHLKDGETLVLPPGTHRFEEVHLHQGAKLVVTGDARIEVDGHLHAHQGAALDFRGGIALSVGGDIHLHGGTTLSAQGPASVSSLAGHLHAEGQLSFAADAVVAAEKHIRLGEGTDLTFQGKGAVLTAGNLDLHKSSSLVFRGEAAIDVGKDFKIKKDSFLEMAQGGVIDVLKKMKVEKDSNLHFGDQTRIFVQKELELKKDTDVATDGKPPRLLAYVWGEKAKFDMEKDSVFSGAVFVPHGKGRIKKDSRFYGSLVAGEIDVEQGVAFHYDEALGRVVQGVSRRYGVVWWREVAR